MRLDIEEVHCSLWRLGLAQRSERPRFTVLSGGVSSDIWRVELANGPVCVKRALKKLRVEADWHVPVERNANEVAWMQIASRIVPGCVPTILGHDREAGLFVMAYVDPATHPVWKEELRNGRADPAVAAQVGDRLGRIHAETAGDEAICAQFATDAIFYAIRLEPYLWETAQAHPELAEPLRRILRATTEARHVLVHGDISPKNVLCGPNGPIFLDAECAWYGDPAFDLAFCLNHLLLKCLWVPASRDAFLASFRALADAYLAHVCWEDVERLERRAAHLLAGLFLARVDGKSPVEYLTDADKTRIRACAGAWLRHPAERLSDIQSAWAAELRT